MRISAVSSVNLDTNQRVAKVDLVHRPFSRRVMAGGSRRPLIPNILPALLSWPGVSRGVEKALHENEIEPATEFVADLPEVGDTLESQALVKPDRRIVRCVYAADHDVLALAESQRK
jgi:hypothetical protein